MRPHEMLQDAPADHTEKFQQKSSVHHPTVSMKFSHKKTCIPLHARPAALQMVLKVSLNRQQAYEEFGHRNTVIIMCGLTALFGLSAFAYMINRNIGFLVMVIILLAVEIFIEKSAMISEKFHPLIGLWHRIQRKSRKIFKKVG